MKRLGGWEDTGGATRACKQRQAKPNPVPAVQQAHLWTAALD